MKTVLSKFLFCVLIASFGVCQGVYLRDKNGRIIDSCVKNNPGISQKGTSSFASTVPRNFKSQASQDDGKVALYRPLMSTHWQKRPSACAAFKSRTPRFNHVLVDPYSQLVACCLTGIVKQVDEANQKVAKKS
jgi:hypothetical protein